MYRPGDDPGPQMIPGREMIPEPDVIQIKCTAKTKEWPGLHASSWIYEEKTNSLGFYNNN